MIIGSSVISRGSSIRAPCMWRDGQKKARQKDKEPPDQSFLFLSRKKHPRSSSGMREKYSRTKFSAELSAGQLLDRQSVALRLGLIGINRAGLHSDFGDNRVGLEP